MHQTPSTRLRILMISPQFRPIVGGYERAAERLSAALAARGHHVTVIAERRDRAWPIKEKRDGFRIRRLWCLYRPRLHMATSLAALTWFLLTRGRRFQVWHLHQYGLHAVLTVAMSKFLSRPVVLKLTSTRDQGLQAVVSAMPLTGIAQRLLRRVDAVVVPTRDLKEEALRFGIAASAVYIVGNGVHTVVFQPRSDHERARLRRRLGIDAEGLVVSVGRLSQEKNPHGLLQAWEIALHDLPLSWKLALVGDGPMRKELEAFVTGRRLEASVIFAGQQSNVEEWLGAADIFVLFSQLEGLSNAMLEAMATGLPVISSRVSGAVEILEDTGAGVVVEIGDTQSLARMLVHLAADPVLRHQIGSAGRVTVERNFSIGAVAQRHEQMYQKLIQARQGFD